MRYHIIRDFLIFTTAFLLSGCAAAGIFSTSDPNQKLKDAFNLLESRPIPRALPAEKLIKEAINDFKEQNDVYGLGVAQFMYGNFVQSKNFDWPQFRKQYPETETREQRNALATTYYVEAANNFHLAAADPKLTHDTRTGYYWREYLAHFYANNNAGACEALKNMQVENDAYTKKNPDAKVYVQPPYKSFSEFMSESKRISKCMDL